jgi:hypothetical protein
LRGGLATENTEDTEIKKYQLATNEHESTLFLVRHGLTRDLHCLKSFSVYVPNSTTVDKLRVESAYAEAPADKIKPAADKTDSAFVPDGTTAGLRFATRSPLRQAQSKQV